MGEITIAEGDGVLLFLGTGGGVEGGLGCIDFRIFAGCIIVRGKGGREAVAGVEVEIGVEERETGGKDDEADEEEEEEEEVVDEAEIDAEAAEAGVEPAKEADAEEEEEVEVVEEEEDGLIFLKILLLLESEKE